VSQENVEIVRSLQPPPGVDLVEVFEGERFERLPVFADPRGLLDPSFECSFIAGESAGSLTLSYRGVQGFIEGWREWLAAWSTYRVETADPIDGGDKVVVPVRVHARTRRGDVEMEHTPGVVWTLDSGKVVRMELYLNGADALKAVGLEE
jgi:ketosteroid isomerase-like protein